MIVNDSVSAGRRVYDKRRVVLMAIHMSAIRCWYGTSCSLDLLIHTMPYSRCGFLGLHHLTTYQLVAYLVRHRCYRRTLFCTTTATTIATQRGRKNAAGARADAYAAGSGPRSGEWNYRAALNAFNDRDGHSAATCTWGGMR